MSLLDELMPKSEPFPGETLLADGWQYRDLQRLSYEMFERFVGIVGEENLRWLTLADYGDAKRGQVFISPDGFARLKEHSTMTHSHGETG